MNQNDLTGNLASYYVLNFTNLHIYCRICTKHVDVCALKKEDWAKVSQQEASLAAQAALDNK